MDTKRRSKYVRSDTPLPYRFNDNGDPEIIYTIWRYRYITTKMLALLIGRSERVVNKRIQALWSDKYLGRLHLSHPRSGGGSSFSIHVLDSKGIEFLKEHYKMLADFGVSPMQNENDKKNLRHSLLVSHIRAVVELACSSLPHLELMFWHKESKRYSTKVTVKNEKLTVKPDSFFGIRDTSRPEGRQRLYFFLEADRSTMKHSDMKKKYRAYFEMWKQRKGKPIGVFDDIKAFRVLTLTEKDSDRLPNLIEDAYETTPTGQGSNMFWFCNQADIPLNDPQTFFKAVWRIGKKDDTALYPISD